MVWVKCQCALPVYILADEKPRRCLTDRVSLPTLVSGRVIGPLGYRESQRAAAFTASYGGLQRMASHTDPSSQVTGALIDGFDSTACSMQPLFPGARLGFCRRHALKKLPDKLIGVSASVCKGVRSRFHPWLSRCRQRTR